MKAKYIHADENYVSIFLHNICFNYQCQSLLASPFCIVNMYFSPNRKKKCILQSIKLGYIYKSIPRKLFTTKVKFSLCLINYTSNHEGILETGGIAPPFLNLALDGDEWRASCPSHNTIGNTALVPNLDAAE
jgi:hypothetical protein